MSNEQESPVSSRQPSSHNTVKVMAKIHEIKLQVVPYAPYSSNLAPSDFSLLSNLKTIFGGKKCESDSEIIAATMGFQALEHRWHRCTRLYRKIKKIWHNFCILFVRLESFHPILVHEHVNIGAFAIIWNTALIYSIDATAMRTILQIYCN